MDQAPTPDDQDLPPRPQPPRDSDCCRSDCPNCVFNLYDRELERWEQQVAQIRARRSGRQPAP
jgi:hypothetical protein